MPADSVVTLSEKSGLKLGMEETKHKSDYIGQLSHCWTKQPAAQYKGLFGSWFQRSSPWSAGWLQGRPSRQKAMVEQSYFLYGSQEPAEEQ